MSLNFIVNIPTDTTELEVKMAEFMAKKVINECKPQEVELIIDYLEKNILKNNKT